MGACRPTLDALPVTAILDSGQPYAGRAYRDCVAAARAHHVRIITATPGMHWSSGDGNVVDVLAPPRPFLADTGDNVNENSIVALLRYRGFRALFTGDAGQAREAQLLASGVDLRADVLKVGHHGSLYVDPGVRRCRRAAHRVDLGGAPQYLRASRRVDANDAPASWRKDLPH